MLFSYRNKKGVVTGRPLQIDMEFNMKNTELEEDDIDKDLFEMYISNLKLLRDMPNVNNTLVNYIDKVLEALKTLL